MKYLIDHSYCIGHLLYSASHHLGLATVSSQGYHSTCVLWLPWLHKDINTSWGRPLPMRGRELMDTGFVPG